MKRRLQIGVIGPERKNMAENAEQLIVMAGQIGCQIALKGAVLITGGCTGIAEAASKGAYAQGGITIGTPGSKRGTSVDGITVEICTPMEIGDYLVAGVLSCDSIIVFPGDAGTLAELAIAYKYKKPLIFIKGFRENLLTELFKNVPKDYPVFVALNAEEAVVLAISAATRELADSAKQSTNNQISN